MAWKVCTMMSEKERFRRVASLPNANMSELCREFGITRKTGYLWKNRKEIKNGLGRSRRPLTSPNQTLSPIEALCIGVRLEHPTWGGVKIYRHLMDLGYVGMPCEKTINRILKRNGFISFEASEKHKPWKRFEHENPNDLWQMDFKGHFETAKGRCHPLTLLDDHSRFSLLIRSCANQKTDTVKQALTDTFREYGLPLRMTMDNGPPFGCSSHQQHTRLTVWLIHLGITVSHSRPYHPQTQGKLERFHRVLNEDLISLYSFDDLSDAQRGFDYFRQIYNEVRPHGAIHLEVPRKRYISSTRMFPEILPSIAYPETALVRKVNSDGIISLKGKRYRVGECFEGYPVALEETDEPHSVNVILGHQKVIKIDLNREAA